MLANEYTEECLQKLKQATVDCYGFESEEWN